MFPLLSPAIPAVFPKRAREAKAPHAVGVSHAYLIMSGRADRGVSGHAGVMICSLASKPNDFTAGLGGGSNAAGAAIGIEAIKRYLPFDLAA